MTCESSDVTHHEKWRRSSYVLTHLEWRHEWKNVSTNRHYHFGTLTVHQNHHQRHVEIVKIERKVKKTWKFSENDPLGKIEIKSANFRRFQNSAEKTAISDRTISRSKRTLCNVWEWKNDKSGKTDLYQIHYMDKKSIKTSVFTV